MRHTLTTIPDVIVFEPRVFEDDRGFFLESFNQKSFEQVTRQHYDFVQDNHSKSSQGVLRGLHYQIQQPQGKLVRVVAGVVFDIAVDIRRSSPNFGAWVGEVISSDNKKQMWIPPGFAHGFLVMSDSAELLYKTTDFYAPNHERCLSWNDPEIGIEWPELDVPFQLSNKDKQGISLAHAECFA
ncbi:dTDP-4-dehydrorhamnose 3,5-epimerase [Methylobacillus gramineus]|uniref:dTDP-4-dehydrorhamnose 3,5-epimerase n=1 Tax=Methylobacillus gramineus TaxID=755169 RepID=UPI001D000787|nr:dTDP-4-dehydrorhamnose 3,5-epimerase [Methylobacillus gramineus]MCB5183704.1 dTDP-4-dehydrorhamnose 3,5-epimerase [Methylobacillus gramineus]